ncbi:hypothetical protein G7Y79_00022g051940 [Physcia stellaris]|nr:hypothetical protein G7Y79_00022g051940 [Physcia stellaris]
MSYAPGWLAQARLRSPSDTRIHGQPNSYREKMAAYGVHDRSGVAASKTGEEGEAGRKAEAEKVEGEKGEDSEGDKDES